VRPRLKTHSPSTDTTSTASVVCLMASALVAVIRKVVGLSRGQPVQKQRVSKPVFMVVHPTVSFELVVRPKSQDYASFGGLLLRRTHEVAGHLVLLDQAVPVGLSGAAHQLIRQ
jgi:hypothetical protein